MIGKLQSQYASDDADRQASLEVVRECCALTKPSILPPLGQSHYERLPDKYDDIGTRCLNNIGSKLLGTLFPVDQPWFISELDPAIEYDMTVADEFKQTIYAELSMRDMLAQSILESANVDPKKNDSRRRRGFRSHKKKVLEQLVATGETLEHMNDDYRMRSFRRDRYVTRRDDSGDVVYHITCEKVDALELGEGVIEAIGLRLSDFNEKPITSRMLDLYTGVEWNPRSKKWCVTQQVNNKDIREEEEHSVSPYFSTCFDLTDGENHARGMIEGSLCDFRTINALQQRLLEMAAIMSKLVPVIDTASSVTVADLSKASGVAILGRVLGGQVQDVAFLQPIKISDYQAIDLSHTKRSLAIAKTFLLEIDAQPRGERVTREQIIRVAQELDEGLNGIYAPISEEQQVPLVQRLMYQLVRDSVLKPLPTNVAKVRTLTGLAALSRQQRLNRIYSVVSLVQQLGPDAIARINMDTLVDVIFRYSAIHETGLVKTREQMQEEVKAAMQQQAQMQASQQMIQSTGKVAETAATGLIQGNQ